MEYFPRFGRNTADFYRVTRDHFLYDKGNPAVVAAAATSSMGWSNMFTRTENPWYFGLELFFGAVAIA